MSKPAIANGAAAKLKPLTSDRLGLAGHLNNAWVANLPDGVTKDQALDGEMWRLMASRFSIGDTIEVRNDSLTMWGLLLVVAANAALGSVHVKDLAWKDLEPVRQASRESSTVEPRWAGVTEKWQLVRKVDGKVMRSNIKTQEDAQSIAVSEFGARVEGKFQTA